MAPHHNTGGPSNDFRSDRRNHYRTCYRGGQIHPLYALEPAGNGACRNIDRHPVAGSALKRFLSIALYSACQVVQLRRINMIRKLNTSGFTLVVVAGLAIGMTQPAVQAYKGFGSFSSGEDRGVSSQSRQVDASEITDRYSMNIDPAAKQQLGEQTFREVAMFFRTAGKAIETKNMEALMAHYSDNYRNGDLDKKSVERAWQRIFARVDALAALNNMTPVNVSADGNMVVLQGDGLLVGVPDGERWPVAVDNWNKQHHILVKEAGGWKLIGIYGPERKRLWFDKPVHPLI